MAGADPQKQLISLIRSFASEKSQGEHRIAGLNERIEQLRSELDSANADLEDAKRLKETTEQELKGLEVELAMSEASIQTLEARISMIQDEISIAGSGLDAMKNEESALRDDFIKKMFQLNKTIRKYQEKIARAFHKDKLMRTSMNEDGMHDFINDFVPKAGTELSVPEDAEDNRKGHDHKIADIISQINDEEQERQAVQNIHNQLQEDLMDLEMKVFLMEAVMKERKELQDLTRQTTEFEEKCASLVDELQKRCICPSCHLDNVETLDGILQARDGM